MRFFWARAAAHPIVVKMQATGESEGAVSIARHIVMIRVVGVLGLLGFTLAVPISSAGAEQSALHAPKGQPSAIGKLHLTLEDPVGMYNDDFGDAVAQSGTNLIVGAAGYTATNNLSPGAAYIYTKGSGGWPTKPSVTLASPCGLCDFGNSVAISGNTAIVGAYAEGGDMYIGEAYVYVKGSSGWPTKATVSLVNPNPYFYDYFGYSVALSGDTAVVGAFSATGIGSAYIYAKTTSGWPSTPTAMLADPGASSADQFAYSVSVSGGTAIIGAPGTTDTQQYAGKAYIYVRGASGWPDVPTKTLLDPDDVKYDQFGFSVAVSGKMAIVDAFGVKNQAGAVYVYQDGLSGWETKPTTTLADPEAKSYDHFGDPLALSGTVAVIGRTGTDSSNGKAYVIDEGRSGWPTKPTVTLADPKGMLSDAFGYAVAASGNDAIVGAYGTYAGTNNNAGAVYVFKAASKK